MTEQEWLKCNRPEVLLQFLARKRTPGLLRKLRLFCCASCRRIEPPLPARAQEIVSIVEDLSDQDDPSGRDRFPDDFQPNALMAETYDTGVKQRAAGQALSTLQFMLLRDRASDAAFMASLGVQEAVVAITGKRPKTKGCVGWEPQLMAQWDKEGNKVRAGFAQLLRHIIGDRLKPYSAPASWPETIVQLATALYVGQDCTFALHDALLEAGHTELAEHFQKEQWHPKGCWALDVILGKR